MASKNDEKQAMQPEELTFILAIAGRIDAQSRIIAEDLHNNRSIYYGYAALDSSSAFYSTFKYFFDLFYTPSDPDLMHDIMLTPGGIASIIFGTTFLVSFSVLATHFDSEKAEGIKKWIATHWPYVRDILKALKNAYKGWRSAMTALHLIAGVDIQYLIAPVGVILGVLGAVNRIWLRTMLEERKQMMSNNTKLFLEIEKLWSLSHAESQSYLQKIAYQTLYQRRRAYFSVAFGGFVDGLYLYMGVLNVAALAPPLFLTIAVICATYTVACIVTRLYEEYDYQRKLVLKQIRCKQILVAKELETAFGKMVELENSWNKTTQDLDKIWHLKKELCELIVSFDQLHELYKEEAHNSYLAAFLLGLKNGLYGYSAMTSILFLLSAILLLSGTAFPPALLVSFILFSVVLVVGFSMFSMVTKYLDNCKLEKTHQSDFEKLAEIKSTLANEHECFLNKEILQKALKEGLNPPTETHYFFKNWFEVIRSLFSGIGKGQKFSDFVGNPLQEMNEQGHWQDTPVMFVLGACSALLFGAILSFRALAKEFGRPDLGMEVVEDNQSDNKKEIELHIFKYKLTKPATSTSAFKEAPRPRSASALSTNSLFSPSEAVARKEHKLPRYHSDMDIKSSYQCSYN